MQKTICLLASKAFFFGLVAIGFCVVEPDPVLAQQRTATRVRKQGIMPKPSLRDRWRFGLAFGKWVESDLAVQSAYRQALQKHGVKAKKRTVLRLATATAAGFLGTVVAYVKGDAALASTLASLSSGSGMFALGAWASGRDAVRAAQVDTVLKAFSGELSLGRTERELMTNALRFETSQRLTKAQKAQLNAEAENITAQEKVGQTAASITTHTGQIRELEAVLQEL